MSFRRRNGKVVAHVWRAYSSKTRKISHAAAGIRYTLTAISITDEGVKFFSSSILDEKNFHTAIVHSASFVAEVQRHRKIEEPTRTRLPLANHVLRSGAFTIIITILTLSSPPDHPSPLPRFHTRGNLLFSIRAVPYCVYPP